MNKIIRVSRIYHSARVLGNLILWAGRKIVCLFCFCFFFFCFFFNVVSFYFSSPEPKAQGELLLQDFVRHALSVMRLSTIYLKDITS